MASLSVRRQSFNGSTTPKIVIPTRSTKEPGQYESLSPSLTVHNAPLSGNLSPELQPSSPELQPTSQVTQKCLSPPSPGNLSPELQPITPPVVNGSNNEVLQIGKYLLVEQLDSNVHKAVDTHTGQEKICKVSF